MSKKVACCIDAWFPLQGGAQYHVAEVYKELSGNSAGYDWHILTRAIRGPKSSPVPALRFGWASFFENPLMRLYYVFRLFVHLLWKGRFYQLYHAQDASSAVAIKMAAFFTNIPTVLTVHGTTLFSPAKNFLSRVKKVLEKLIFLKLRYDALLSVSSNLREASGAKTPTSLLRNGVRMERFGPLVGTVEGPLRLLFVGRLENIKGLFVLFKALEGLGNSVQLCVVGDGSLRESLEKEAMEKKLPVVFLGALEGENLAQVYGENEVFVLSSLSEGFPLTLLEASAAGLAIVATRTGDVSTLVHEGKNGLLVNVGAVKELTEAIRVFIKDRSLAKRMGVYGREKVAPLFTWKQSAATIENAYEQALWHEKPRWLSRLRSVWKDPRMPWRLGRILRERRHFMKGEEVNRADVQALFVAFTVDVEQEGGSGLKNGGLGERTKHLSRFFREFSEKMGPLKIPASLFVQGELIPDFREELRAAQAAGNELGIHGYTHELWGQRPWFVKDPWQNPAHRFFYLKTIREELRAAGLENVRAFRAPNMVSDATTEKLLVHFGFSLDSSGAVQLGEAPLPGTKVSGKLASLPVSRDPQPCIKWVFGLPFGHYGVMNMAHFATWTEGELLAAVERLYAYHRAHGLQPHLVFLAHSWDISPHWELLEKRLKLLQSKYSIKFLTLSALNDS